jgi:hypothetical protein
MSLSVDRKTILRLTKPASSSGRCREASTLLLTKAPLLLLLLLAEAPPLLAALGELGEAAPAAALVELGEPATA